MGIYTIGMISMVVLSTAALVYILKKNSLLNLNMVAAIAVSSVSICLLIPFIFSKISLVGLNFIPAILITILLYITVVFVVAVAISVFVTEKKAGEILDKILKSKVLQACNTLYTKITQKVKTRKTKYDDNVLIEIEPSAKDDKLGETLQDSTKENSDINMVNIAQDGSEIENEPPLDENGMDYVDGQVENILEKHVDTERIIDKMGIENVNEDILGISVSLECDKNLQSIEQPELDSSLYENKEDNTDDAQHTEKYEVSIDYYNTGYFEENTEKENIVFQTDYTEQCDETAVFVSDEVEENLFGNDLGMIELPLQSSADVLKEAEEDAAPVIEEFTAIEETAIEETAIEIKDLLQEKIPVQEEYVPDGVETVDESPVETVKDPANINDSISGDTWCLQTEQSIGNIDIAEDIVKIDKEDNREINDFINEAFRLKENGDKEGAILHYMYALEKNPEIDAVFWIVLDTCVLYKELGQVDLAKEILEGYVSDFGDVINPDIKAEIERNLSN
ncbi:MAG: hypothetical protein N3I35_03865 [Clostridia bacterium]|nr:hypothetical protein [Clostridia bacterium]